MSKVEANCRQVYAIVKSVPGATILDNKHKYFNELVITIPGQPAIHVVSSIKWPRSRLFDKAIIELVKRGIGVHAFVARNSARMMAEVSASSSASSMSTD